MADPRVNRKLTIEEQDGSPSVVGVQKILVSNGTLSDSGGGVVSITTGGGGGGGSPGGSDGQVQYNNAGAFGGASALTYDDTNNRVGINTTSPAAKLEVVATTASEYGAIIDHVNGQVAFTQYGGIHLDNAESTPNLWQISERDGESLDFAFGTPDSGLNVGAANTQLRITSGGLVGIGTGSTDPTETLEVAGNVLILDPNPDGSSDHLLEVRSPSSATPDNARVLVSADTDSKLPMFNLRDVEVNGGTFNSNYSAYMALERNANIIAGAGQNDFLIVNGNFQKKIHFCTNDSGDGNVATAKMTLDDDGLVGIGTTSPSETLDVVGTAAFSDDLSVNTDTLFVDVSSDAVGIGTASIGSGFSLEVAGQTKTEAVVKDLISSADNPLNIDANLHEVVFSTTAAAVINLPAATPDGLKFTIKDLSGTGNQLITPQAGQAIELPTGGLGTPGAAWVPLTPYQSQDFIAHETNWYLI